jgi:hypothetical protein
MAVSVQAQDKKVIETEFKVTGNCSMCQARIQLAASIKGVKKAEWNKDTQMLKVIFNPDKVEIIDIHRAVAGAGHDTSILSADKQSYDKLPHCCAYRYNHDIH